MFLIIGLILTFILGYLLVTALAPKLEIYERIFLAVVVGMGVMTQILFAMDVVNIKYSSASIISILLGVNFLFSPILFLRKNEVKQDLKRRLFGELITWLKNLSWVEKIIVFLLLFLIVSAFARALFWPVFYWDALALYDYRGRIFSEAEGIAASAALSSLPMHSYPPMTSLAHAFVYVLGGEGANPQFIYPLFYVSLLATFYASVRKYCMRWASLLVTLFLISTPMFVEFSANAYTNLPYAFYFGMGTVYLYRFIKEEDWGLLAVAGILLGLSGWTRSPTEQFFAVDLIILVIACIWKRRHFLAPLLLVSLFMALSFFWRIYVANVLNLAPVSTEVTNALSSVLSQPPDLGKLFSVIILLMSSIKAVSGTALSMVLLAAIFFPAFVKKNVLLFSIISLNFIILVVGSYSFSLSWEDWKDSITNSADRLSMIFPPIALFFMSINVPILLSKLKDKK